MLRQGPAGAPSRQDSRATESTGGLLSRQTGSCWQLSGRGIRGPICIKRDHCVQGKKQGGWVREDGDPGQAVR